MSLLPYATLYGPGQPIYIPVGTQVSSFGISSLNANTITTDRIITGESIFSTIIGSNVFVNNLDASFIQVLDTLDSYFTNSEYATVNCNLTVSNDAQLNQVFANYVSSEAIDVEQSYISSIRTTSINLDDNLLDTAGAGAGAVLLLNGIPIATTSTSISSLTDWSFYPALSSIYMNNNDIIDAGHIYANDLTVYDLISTSDINSRYINVQCNINVGNESILNQVAANYVGTESFDCQQDAFISSIITNGLEATTATFDTVTTINQSNTTINANTINTEFLTVNQLATFPSPAQFNQGFRSLQNVDFCNQTLVNVANITTANTQNMTLNSAWGLLLQAKTQIALCNDEGTNVAANSEILINAQNGNRGKITVLARPGYGGIQGEVSIEARGGSAAGYATGGLLDIKATSGTSVFGTLNTSRVAIAADSITSYAGPIQPFAGLFGYNFVQGTLGVNVVAGGAPTLPNVPGTVYLWGLNPLGFGSSGGVRVQNGMSIDYITPYPQGFIAPEYDLFIRGNPAGQKVTLCNVRYLFGDSAEATGFNNMNATNLNGTNLNATNIYGTNISASNLYTSTGTISSLTSLNAQIKQIYNVSTINGYTINQLISSVTPPQIVSTISTFSELYTSSLFANSISTNQLQAYYLTAVSTINGFTIAELVSSVSPPTPAPSTFAQLYTSSLVANNVSTLTLQAGQILLNGVPLSPPGQQISTFNQLFTSSLAANTISAGTVTFSTLNGYNISSIVNQPIVSTFFELFVSSGTINNLSNIVLQVSSINGYNTNDFLSTSGFTQLSSFNQFFTNTLSTGVITLSSINGYNTSQFLNNPPLSSFQQFYVSDLNTNNFSSFTGNVSALTGVSTINGYTIAQFISTATPPPPQLSTFTQLFASSIGGATSSLNLFANCNINLAANCNIVLNTSNGVSIYTTLTAPPIPQDGIIILGQGNTTLASQSNTYMTAANNILVNATQIAVIQGGDYVQLNTNLGLQLTASNNILAAASTINLNGSVFVNNQPYGQLVSSYQQLFTSSLVVNTINGAAYPPPALSTQTASSFSTIFTNKIVNLPGNPDVVVSSFNFNSFTQGSIVGAANAIVDFFAGESFKVSTNNIILNAPQTTISNNLNVSSINGAAYPPSSSQQLSTFSTIFTQNIRSPANTINTQAVELLFSSSQEIINTNEILVYSKSLIDLFAETGCAISSPLIYFYGQTNVVGNLQVSTINNSNYGYFNTLYADMIVNNTSPYLNINGNITQISSSDCLINAQSALILNSKNLITLLGNNSVAISSQNVYIYGDTTFYNSLAVPAISNVSSINGAAYPPAATQQISTFQQLFTSSFNTNTINGAAYPPVQTQLSTFQQLTTSSFTVNTINGAAYPPTQTLFSTFSNIYVSNILNNSNITISSIGTLNLNCVPPPTIYTTPIQFATGQIFPQPGLGRFQFLTNNSAVAWTNVLLTDSFANVYYNAAWAPSASISFPITATIGTSGYYDLKIEYPAGTFSEYLVQYEPDGTILYGIVTPTTANFTWGQGAAQAGKINLNSVQTNIQATSTINLTSPSLLWNGNPLAVQGTASTISTYQQLFTSTISMNYGFFSNLNGLGSSNKINGEALEIEGAVSLEFVAGTGIDILTLSNDINLRPGFLTPGDVKVYGNMDMCNHTITNLGSISTLTTNLTINTAADFDVNVSGGFHVGVVNDIDLFGNNNINILGSGGRFDLATAGIMNISNEDYTLTTTSSITITNGTQTDIQTAEFNLYTDYFNRNLLSTLVRQPIIQIGKGIGGPANSGYVNITLPVSYGNTNYNVSVLATPNGNDIPSNHIPSFCADVISGNSMDIYWQGGSGSHQVYFDWETFGYYGTDTGTGTGTDTGSGTGTGTGTGGSGEGPAENLDITAVGDTIYTTWTPVGSPDYFLVSLYQSGDDVDFPTLYSSNITYPAYYVYPTVEQNKYYRFDVVSYYGGSNYTSSNSSSVYVYYI